MSGSDEFVEGYDGTCDDCGAPADPKLKTPMCALCFDCWDGTETPLETKDRLAERI